MKGSAKIDKERRGGCSQILAVEEGGNDTNGGDERDRLRISRAAQDARCSKRRFGTRYRDFANICTEPPDEIHRDGRERFRTANLVQCFSVLVRVRSVRRCAFVFRSVRTAYQSCF